MWRSLKSPLDRIRSHQTLSHQLIPALIACLIEPVAGDQEALLVPSTGISSARFSVVAMGAPSSRRIVYWSGAGVIAAPDVRK
jgi:hypothetical protein